MEASSLLFKSDDENDTVTDSMKLLSVVKEEKEDQIQQHYLTSIDSSITIRQITSQGLSFQLWPAATTLVTLLDHHHRRREGSPISSIFNSDRRLKILELGSGTGLVGIAAAILLSADVTVTDLPHVISNLQFNVDANKELLKLHNGVVHVAELKWGEDNIYDDDVAEECCCYDIVLGSDVVYYDYLYEPLLKTLRLLLLEKETVFLMAHLKRWKKDSMFFKRARKVFDVETVHVDSPVNGDRIGVVVYSFVGKKKPLNRQTTKPLGP
ncbi:hypothetical protein ACFE04_024122 [Oxalis oulophora]